MNRTILFAGVVATATFFVSSYAHADPPRATSLWQAPTTTLQERPGAARYLTQTGGAGLFLASYVPSVVVAAASSRDDDKRLYIPLAGPWLDLGERDCSAHPCAAKGLTGFLLGLDGVAQAVGLVSFLGGALAPAANKPKVLGEDKKIHISPAHMGYEGYGLSAFGNF